MAASQNEAPSFRRGRKHVSIRRVSGERPAVPRSCRRLSAAASVDRFVVPSTFTSQGCVQASEHLFVVVVGCGRYGSHLANGLSAAGHSVVVIDHDPARFDTLTTEFSGFRVEADATELATLREAKLDQADLLVAATHSDNVNIMVAQVAARIFGTPRVIARVSDPRRESVFRDLGIETVSPTSLATKVVFESLGLTP